ncbi:MAG: ATP-binding protein [Candidatus Nanoarchaeia archaeon]
MSLPKLEVMENIATYIAPHILGNKTIKEFLALQMFINPDKGEKLNYIIIGTTSTGKTEVCRFVSKVLVGKSSFVQRDATPVGCREKIIGSNGGIVYFDELDKAKKDMRNMLLEALQNGTVTIDKANEHITYDAKICATALVNPPSMELSKEIPLYSQISFAKDYYLLNRFHFILPIYSADASIYPDIAEKYEEKRYTEEDIVNRLREIVYSVKQEVPTVELNREITRSVGEYIRYLKEINYNNMLITPRLIEGFLSAVKARARMCLRKQAKEEDVEYVKRIYTEITSL